MAGGKASEFLTMGNNHKSGQALGGDFLEGLHDVGGIGTVEIAGRFVGEKEAGISRESAGKSGTLHLSPAELVGVVSAATDEAGKGQSLIDPRTGLTWRITPQEKRKFHILSHGHGGQKIKELKNDTEIVAAITSQFSISRLMECQVSNPNFAGIGLVEAAKEIQKSALATTTGTSDGHEVAKGDFQADLLEGWHGVAGAGVDTTDFIQTDHAGPPSRRRQRESSRIVCLTNEKLNCIQ